MKIPFRFKSSSQLTYLLTASVTGFVILFHQPLHAQVTTSVNQQSSTPLLAQLPAPDAKIVAMVYSFRVSTDQQSLPKSSIHSIAAVYYTSTLFDVLRSSGWFVPTDYTDVGNLLNGQREKPSTTVAEGNSSPALQTPTVILEAGLLSHDATILSDEAGNLYFAGGVPNRYRRDQATVFIRALSAQSGKILKTVYWSKTVLSQPTDTNTYRYVLLNKSTDGTYPGTTSTPPDQLVITEAIKQAVNGLIIEGIRDGLWIASDVSNTQLQTIIAAYEAEKIDVSVEKQSDKQHRKQLSSQPQIDPSFVSVCLYGGLMRYHGDYVNWDREGAYGLSVEAYATPRIGFQLNASTGTLSSRNAFTTNLTSLETNLIIRILPYWRLTPLVYGGVGIVSRSGANPFSFEGTRYIQYQGGIGLQYSRNNIIGLRAMLSYNQLGTDKLDGKQIGSHNDFYVRTTLGLIIHFGRYVPKPKQVTHK